MKKLLFVTISLIVAVAAMAAGKATVYFSVTPRMNCENCENRVKGALRYEKGVKTVQTSIVDQIVTVTYDPQKVSVASLQAAIKKAGYTATVTKNAPKHKSSATCSKRKAQGKCDHKCTTVEGAKQCTDGCALKEATLNGHSHKCSGDHKK